MAPQELVTLEVQDGVAILTLNAPPVNALRPDVFEALFSALRKAHQAADARAVVLTGANGKFSGGFDVNLFGSPSFSDLLAGRAQVLGQMAALLENASKPSVAAIQGLALGGGLELAMACNARVAAAGAVLGLPEVRLGVLPGLGGTQRLPRLVGFPQALDLMLSGQTISAERALELGLADRVVPPQDLLAAAKTAALELASGKAPRRRTLQLKEHYQQEGDVFVSAVGAVQEAAGKARRGARVGQLQYPLLVEAVAAGLASGVPAGLQAEGEGFAEASQSVVHRLLLSGFRMGWALKKARGPAWVLLQLRLLLLGLWILIVSHFLHLKNSFVVGYQKARSKRSAGAAATQAAGGAGGKAAAGGSSKGAAKRRGSSK